MIYVDVFVFVNIFEDFLLLLTVKRVLRLGTPFFRLILGSAAGGLLGITVLFNTPFVISAALKVITASVMTAISFGFKRRKAFFKALAALLICTFLVSGALICFWLALKPDGMAIINGAVYFDISPLLLIILTLAIYFILLLFRKVFKNHSKAELIKDVIIRYKNNKCSVKCKVDSGLNVKEPFSGADVIIVEKRAISFAPDSKKLRLIPYSSLGGNGTIWGFKPDEVVIDGAISGGQFYVGMTDNAFGSQFCGLIPKGE